jgi:cytosine/uracil/thiamine/allantoin permease
MRHDTQHKVSFMISALIAGGMSAWGIVNETPYMFVAAGFMALYSIGVLLGAILSVLIDIRDDKKENER